MAGEIDYQAVLDDLLTKKAELEAAINAVRRILGQPADVTSPSAPAVQKDNGGSVGPDSFLGLSVSEAAKKYLRMTRRPQSAAAISEALETGGLQSSAKNFYRTVWTAINREENIPGGFIKVGSKAWGLAEWYPDRALRRKTKNQDSQGGDEKE